MGIVGLLVAFALLVVLAMRGTPILLIALVCTVVVAVSSGRPVYETMATDYMTGYVGFLRSNFLIFLAGALFGRMMEITYGANSVAEYIVRKTGKGNAVLASVLSCAVLAYGGVSVFVVGFTVYPIAVSLFREADLPRAYLPGALGFGSVTFAMTSPGTPQIQNIIPTQTLPTNTMAGSVIGIIAGVFMLFVGHVWLMHMIRKAVQRGERFELRDSDVNLAQVSGRKLPPPLFAMLPLIVTIVVMNGFKVPAPVSIALSIVIGLVLMFKQYDRKQLFNDFSRGAASAVTAITNTCAVVGFGYVVRNTDAFQAAVAWVTSLPILPLAGAAISVTVICGITGSASGGLGISIPIVGPIYMGMGVAPAAIHRVASIASGALDSLPHNGYIITLLNICGTSHKEGYKPLFCLTVIIPAVATALGVVLFQLFPNWP